MEAGAGIARVDLDGRPNKPMAICMSGAGGFVGSHLCEKLMAEWPRKVPEPDVYSDKIKHLFEQSTLPLVDRVQFHRVNIKHNYRLEGLIKTSNLTIMLATSCTLADYNTRPPDTVFSNFINALPVVMYCCCLENGKPFIHFSTCEVCGKRLAAFFRKITLSARILIISFLKKMNPLGCLVLWRSRGSPMLAQSS